MSPEHYPYNIGTWHDDRMLTDTPDMGEWRCPYCGTAMPDGVDHPSVWSHCGEVGHAEHWHLERSRVPQANGPKYVWRKSDHDEKLY